MNSRGETREQQPIPDTVGLCAEHASLGVAVAGLTAAAIALAVEHTTNVVILRGGYSIVAALIVIGFTGWIVGAAERRVRRDLGSAAAELTAELAGLRDQVQRQRIVYLPAPGRQGGHMYASAAADSGAEAHRSAAVDPEDLREQVERVVVEELGTRESVRAEGYAEGYVDGVARRGDGDPASN